MPAQWYKTDNKRKMEIRENADVSLKEKANIWIEFRNKNRNLSLNLFIFMYFFAFKYESVRCLIQYGW